VFPEEELKELETKHKYTYGFQNTCPPTSPMGYTHILNQDFKTRSMKEAYPLRGDVNWERPKSFIADVRRATDYCENPDLARTVSPRMVQCSLGLEKTISAVRTKLGQAICIRVRDRGGERGAVVWAGSGRCEWGRADLTA
jgi:hypothetical protein